MTYKEYQKALKAIEKKHEADMDKLHAEIYEVRNLAQQHKISKEEAWDKEMKLAASIDFLKNHGKRSIERLKMNFARQDAPAWIGDIIWAMVKGSTKVMKVTDVRVAAFDYPMLKFFGIQLTVKGIPAKVQKEPPLGGIYQKDITSVNGEPYTYKTK